MSCACFKKLLAGFWLAVSGVFAQVPDTIIVAPRLGTSPVVFEADDPAIWRHPHDAAQSLIIGTDKGTYPDGGLFVWNLDGTLQQRLNISHPNNVDVRYGLELAGQHIDFAAVSMRDHRQVRIFKIDSDSRMLSEVTTRDSSNVLRRMFKSPYGLTLYQRRWDGAFFIFVSSRHNESQDKLWQIRLQDDGTGHVKGALVRELGQHRGIVEGMVADDILGFLYASEQKAGIAKYYADPERGETRLAFFGTEDSLAGNFEGLALYPCSDSTGYLLASRPAARCITLYRREGEPADAHRHNAMAVIRNAGGESGDGLEISNRRYGTVFPNGFLIWHNQNGRNFQLYAWEEIAQNRLRLCSEGETRASVGQNSSGTTRSATGIALQQNYPNPFNPDTEISFVLRQPGAVRLTVYNVLGKEVRRLLEATLSSGTHAVRWDARDNFGALLGSGVYFCQIQTGSVSQTRRMLLSR